MYEYNAKVLAIIDGDTLDLLVDLGFDPVYRRIKRARLYGVNTPETPSISGKAAKAYVESRISVDQTIRIKTIKTKTGEKTEKYGGYLVIIVLKPEDPNALTLNDELLANGHAKPYFGGAK